MSLVTMQKGNQRRNFLVHADGTAREDGKGTAVDFADLFMLLRWAGYEMEREVRL